MTVYRRGGGIRQLLLDALIAEFRNAVEEVTALVLAEQSPRDGRAAVTALAVAMVRKLSQAPLVAALLKHDPEVRHIPVNVISVADHIHRCFHMGALGVVQKPAAKAASKPAAKGAKSAAKPAADKKTPPKKS